MGRIPSRLKLDGFRGLKRLQKRALVDRLPPAILRCGKQGFGVPFGDWFRGPLAGSSGRCWRRSASGPEGSSIP